MLVKRDRPWEPRASEITDEKLYWNRRVFMRALGAVATAGVWAYAPGLLPSPAVAAQTPLSNLRKSSFSTDEEVNEYEDITTYNNFYEFGIDKSDPARYAGQLKVRPWSIAIEGHVNKPG